MQEVRQAGFCLYTKNIIVMVENQIVNLDLEV